jgi:hypothetical protein
MKISALKAASNGALISGIMGGNSPGANSLKI